MYDELTLILSGPSPGDGHPSKYAAKSWSMNSNTKLSLISFAV